MALFSAGILSLSLISFSFTTQFPILPLPTLQMVALIESDALILLVLLVLVLEKTGEKKQPPSVEHRVSTLCTV